MKKIYFLCMLLLAGGISFAKTNDVSPAGTWVQAFDFVTNFTDYGNPPYALEGNKGWTYATDVVPVPTGAANCQSWMGSAGSNSNTAWASGQGYDYTLKPAGTWLILRTQTAAAVKVGSSYSVISPAFTPSTTSKTLYYQVQEVKANNTVAPKTGDGLQLFVEVSTDDGGTWTTGTNVLVSISGHNTATTAITTQSLDLSAYAGQAIRIRFRGIADGGPFVPLIYSVALVSSEKDLVISALTVDKSRSLYTQVPLTQSQITYPFSVDVTNMGAAIAADDAVLKYGFSASMPDTESLPAIGVYEKPKFAYSAALSANSCGKYSLYTEVALSGDINPNDNKASKANLVEVTPNTFAWDDDIQNIATAGSAISPSSYSNPAWGHQIALVKPDKISGFSIAFGSQTAIQYAANDKFLFVIYQIDPQTGAIDPSFSYTSPETFLRPETPSQGDAYPDWRKYKEYTLATPVSLEAGVYVCAIKNSGSGTGNALVPARDENTAGAGYVQVPAAGTGTPTKFTGNAMRFRIHTVDESAHLLSTTPADGDTNITPSYTVEAVFDKEITLGDKTGVKIDNGNVTNVTQPNNTTLRIAHSPFPMGATYTVHIPAAAIAGYTGGEITWSFTTADPAKVVTYSPAENATDVALDAEVSVVFDRAVLRPRIPQVNRITIVDEDGNNIADGSVNYPPDQTKLVIGCSKDFEPGTTYTVTIPNGAVNDQYDYPGDISWSFTTKPAVEPLTLVSKTPDADAADVDLNALVAVTFDKAVTLTNSAGTQPSIVRSSDGTAILGPDYRALKLVVDASDNTKVTLPHEQFPTNSTFTVAIPAGAIAGYDQAITWSFTTAPDPINLVAGTYTPADGATGVALKAEVAVTISRSPNFNAPADWSKVTIKDAEGNAVAGVNVSIPGGFLFGNVKLTIAHADFAYNKTYTVSVPKAAIVGLTSDISWSFTTEKTAISVVEKMPTAGFTNVATNAVVSVTFDKDVASNGTPDLSGITISDVTSVNAVVEDNVITINHDAFTYNKEYTVTIPAGAVIGYDEAITWTFKTGLATLSVVGVTPADNSDRVAVDAAVTITFDKAVTTNGAIDASRISIPGATGVSATASGNTLTITHDAFANKTKYTVVLLGGAVAGYDGYVWSFTTIQGTGIQDVAAAGSKIYSANGRLYVSGYSAGTTVAIYNVLGKLVSNYRVTSDNLSVDLSSGAYIVNVQSQGKTNVHKVLVK